MGERQSDGRSPNDRPAAAWVAWFIVASIVSGTGLYLFPTYGDQAPARFVLNMGIFLVAVILAELASRWVATQWRRRQEGERG